MFARQLSLADTTPLTTTTTTTPQGDQRLPHDSGMEVDAESLAWLGVLYYRIPELAEVDLPAAARGYRNRDEIKVSPTTMGDVHETKVKNVFEEHLYEDEEIRYVRDGAGYFDVRDASEAWVRIRLEKDDLNILPASIYRRFTTDETNYTHAMRLFKDKPKWTPLNRSGDLDGNQFRQEYVTTYLQ